jgi:transposase-like protein
MHQVVARRSRLQLDRVGERGAGGLELAAQRIAEFERKVRELSHTNDILKAATAFFARA